MKRPTKPLEIQYLPVKLLTHRPDNARSITPEKFTDLKKSIEAWDFAEPIVVHKKGEVYTIISGHKRAMAAQELKYDSVPCVVLEGMTTKQIAALGIRLNRSNGEDVADELAEVLSGLDDELQAMAGFDEIMLADLQPDPFSDNEEPVEKPSKAKRYTSVDLREYAKSYHPASAQTILEFCDWLDSRHAT